MCKKNFCLIIVILVLGIVGSAFAIDTNWTNSGGDRDWDNASNWDAGVPTAADKAGIRAGMANGPIISSGTSAVANQLVCGDWQNTDVMDITGGTLTTSSWFILGYGPSDDGTFNISGGVATATSTMQVGRDGVGRVNITGGTFAVPNTTLELGALTGSGHVQLYGGVITCSGFSMSSTSSMDITEGTLIINGDATSLINGYIGSGLIVAYAGSGNVLMDYNITNAGKTTVTAQTGEKAGYPTPANGATGVSINADLSWSSGIYATSQDVYFGTDSTPDAGEFQGNQTETTFTLPELALDTAYFWRIDGVDVGNPESPWIGDVWSFTTQASTATLKKGPYLIYPGLNTQMQVLWQLDYSDTCSIEWGLDTSYSDGSAGVPEYGDHQYKHTITGLTPGAFYYYKITVGSGFAAGSFTAAPANSATSVKFVMFGDTRTNPGSMAQVTGAVNNLIASDPAYQSIMLLPGDFVSNGDLEADWTDEFFNRTYLENLEFQATVPIAGTQGNHEANGVGYEKYFPYPYVGNKYWSFDYGPVHVAVVNVDNESISTGSAQYNWLVNDLANSIKPFKILNFHMPGWGAGTHSNDADVQTYLQPLCEQYGVQMCVSGHNHNYVRAEVNGIRHITSGGGGAGLYNVDPGMPNVVVAVMTLNFQTVEVVGNTMYVTSYDPDMTVLDSFEIYGGSTTCGDGPCEGNENQCNCPEDCGSPPSSETSCTDGEDNDCDNYTDCDDSDCSSDPVCECGNGTCDPGEDCNTCSEDCISRAAPPKHAYCCGDGTCEGAENETNCAVDCGGGSYCDDGTCDPGEDQCNCPQDCGTPPSTETSCTDGEDNDCDTDVDCDDSDCVGDPACPTCDDGTCDPGEDQCNCPEDCGTPPATETNCTDGIDEDCDGGADCDDTTGDCDLDPACDCAAVGEACTVDSDCCSNNCFERKGYCKN